jgi:hypothetical protein
MTATQRLSRRASGLVALITLAATFTVACDGSDPTVGSCQSALVTPLTPSPTVLLKDRGTPMPRVADTTVDLELTRQYLQQTIQELSTPITDSSGVWPTGGLEVTSITLGDSSNASKRLPSGSLQIHFHPMTGNSTSPPLPISTLNYTITATLVPYSVDHGVVLRLTLDSVYSNSGNKEIAKVEKGSGAVTCSDSINIVDEKIINAVNDAFVLKDTTFPMPSQQILDVLAGMLDSTPNLSGFAVTTTSNGLRAGFAFNVRGNLHFGEDPLWIERYFGAADWGIRISSTFINSQIHEKAREGMKPWATLTGVETHYSNQRIDVIAAGVSNGGCHIYAATTASPVVRVDNLGHRLLFPSTEPKTSTGQGEGLCALVHIVIPRFLMGKADMVVNGGGAYGGCPNAVGGVLEFRPFMSDTGRPHLSVQQLYASDVAVDELENTADPNDGIFLIAGRVSTLDEAAAARGAPRPAVPHC